MDRKRETKKGVMAESLEELISRGEFLLFLEFGIVFFKLPKIKRITIFLVLITFVR